MDPSEQAEGQGPRRYVVSPLNGARAPMLRKGETHNRAGSSAATRIRTALAKALRGPGADDLIKSMIKLASDPANESTAVAAFRSLCAAAGMNSPEIAPATVTEVRTTLVFERRPGDEQPVPQRRTAAPARTLDMVPMFSAPLALDDAGAAPQRHA